MAAAAGTAAGTTAGTGTAGTTAGTVCRSLDLLGSVITFSVMRLFLSRSNLVDHALRQKGHFFVSGTLITVQKGWWIHGNKSGR